MFWVVWPEPTISMNEIPIISRPVVVGFFTLQMHLLFRHFDPSYLRAHHSNANILKLKKLRAMPNTCKKLICYGQANRKLFERGSAFLIWIIITWNGEFYTKRNDEVSY